MVMGCNGICLRHKVKRGIDGYYNDKTIKRCQVCEIFIKWEGSAKDEKGLFCPCCNYRLRTKPRNMKYKEKLSPVLRYDSEITFRELILNMITTCEGATSLEAAMFRKERDELIERMNKMQEEQEAELAEWEAELEKQLSKEPIISVPPPEPIVNNAIAVVDEIDKTPTEVIAATLAVVMKKSKEWNRPCYICKQPIKKGDGYSIRPLPGGPKQWIHNAHRVQPPVSKVRSAIQSQETVCQ